MTLLVCVSLSLFRGVYLGNPWMLAALKRGEEQGMRMYSLVLSIEGFVWRREKGRN